MRYDIFMFSASNFHCDSCCFQTDTLLLLLCKGKRWLENITYASVACSNICCYLGYQGFKNKTQL